MQAGSCRQVNGSVVSVAVRQLLFWMRTAPTKAHARQDVWDAELAACKTLASQTFSGLNAGCSGLAAPGARLRPPTLSSLQAVAVERARIGSSSPELHCPKTPKSTEPYVRAAEILELDVLKKNRKQR